MNKIRVIMKRVALSLLAAMVMVTVSAQEKKKEYPKPASMPLIAAVANIRWLA